MSDESQPDKFDEVRAQELDEIVKRRREANVETERDENGSNKTPAGDLVGLALSGGGVRSASFNLGFIQSLYERGLLRHVDYMSTVSGGGYVGSSLSSLALHPETEFDWKTEQPGSGSTDDDAKQPAGQFPLSPRDDGRQPPRVLDLIHGGHYLRRPLIFLNRYLVGVLLTNVVALSLVFAVAALAACLFRYLDHTWMINWLFALGFQGDIGRAFFPMTLFFFLWLVMWGISYWRKGSQAEGGVARWFMTLTIVSLLLAGAALLGTGDVSLTHLRDNYGIEPPSDLVRSVGGELKTYFMIALVIALIPYLRIKDLIRSGTRPRSAAEGWVFGIASRALLYGIPLLIFGWLARENISHFNENRTALRHGQTFNTQADFVPLDFRDWSGTWQEIELQATKLNESQENESQEIGRFAVSQRMWESVDHAEVAKSRSLLKQLTAFDRDATMLKRWLLYMGYVVTRQTNDVTDQFQRRQDYRALQHSVCKQLTNSVLVDPAFYKQFSHANEGLSVELAAMTDDERNARIGRIKALGIEAKYLEQRVADMSKGERYDQWLTERNAKLPPLDNDPLDGVTENTAQLRGDLQKLVALNDIAAPGMPFRQWLAQRHATLDTLDQNELHGVTENNVQLGDDLEKLMTLAGGGYAELEAEVKALNWQLTLTYWGKRFSPKSTVYAMVCLEADQSTRWAWFMWSLAFFALSACVVNMNATSLHGFYRNMLSKMWVTECPGIGRRIPLARLETVARGAPYHLISATVHLLGRRRETDRSTTDVFTFSQLFCGSNRTGYVPTERYMNGRFDLSNAMALSGAAVSPTQVHNPLLAVLLMLSNSRLGQWLPNPGYRVLMSGGINRWLSWFPPVPLRLIFGALQQAEQRKYCFVSDGGHHENLGLESLLLRRCRLIIATDVTGDPTYSFRDFTRLLRRMRFEFGIQIVGLNGRNNGVPLDSVTPERLKADSLSDLDDTTVNRLSQANNAEAHYFIARIRYPSDGPPGSPREGYLVYVKPNFTGDEAVDLTRYQLEDPAFPHDPTADQFYDPQKFESYRQLGFHIGNTVCYQQFLQDQGAGDPMPLGNWSPSNETGSNETGSNETGNDETGSPVERDQQTAQAKPSDNDATSRAKQRKHGRKPSTRQPR